MSFKRGKDIRKSLGVGRIEVYKEFFQMDARELNELAYYFENKMRLFKVEDGSYYMPIGDLRDFCHTHGPFATFTNIPMGIEISPVKSDKEIVDILDEYTKSGIEIYDASDPVWDDWYAKYLDYCKRRQIEVESWE